jgi:hypothetical protein
MNPGRCPDVALGLATPLAGTKTKYTAAGMQLICLAIIPFHRILEPQTYGRK